MKYRVEKDDDEINRGTTMCVSEEEMCQGGKRETGREPRVSG